VKRDDARAITNIAPMVSALMMFVVWSGLITGVISSTSLPDVTDV
jgi:hypothetical protein